MSGVLETCRKPSPPPSPFQGEGVPSPTPGSQYESARRPRSGAEGARRGEGQGEESGHPELGSGSQAEASLLSRRARMIVHDLRNPLSVIRGYLQVASRSQGKEDEDGVRSYLDGALAATTELDEMIQSMLDLAVVEEGSFEPKRMPVDVEDLLKRIEKRLGPWIRQEARDLTIESPTEPVEVFADPVFVERAVKNLVMHAVRRSPVGTKIVLECEKRDGGVTFSVRDQGPFVSPASEKDYFDPASADEHRELGWKADRAFALACVKRVAEGHGGSVGIESGPEGTRFFVSLPEGGGKNGNACE